MITTHGRRLGGVRSPFARLNDPFAATGARILAGAANQEIARKYAGDKTAGASQAEGEERRQRRLGAIPMPPTSTASDADIAAMVEWILSLK